MNSLNQKTKESIEATIQNNEVVLFMKGSPSFPMCGFSAMATDILQSLNITFADVDVLKDDDLRQGLKIHSDWPTIPQLYVKGEFIGGCDILREMHGSGELKELFAQKGLIKEEA